MLYDPRAVAAFFDELAEGEWQRFDKDALAAVQEHIHNYYLERFIKPGARVLEIGPGPGRFTQTLHRLGCTIVAVDISGTQLQLHERYGVERGFGVSVSERRRLDICDLSELPEHSFDAIVAYGGPLSYVFERREDAMLSCRRVLRSRGLLLASVMSLWGTFHRFLLALQQLPASNIADIAATGDLTPANDPTSKHKCHLYRSSELAALFTRHGFQIQAIAASNALSTNLEPLLAELRGEARQWQTLLALEEEATAQPGFLDGGTHIILAALAA
jgi:2-polyprenyl-3-methyl-5-hydroxy-6-metoxy-1,4-benzoquinol methylase